MEAPASLLPPTSGYKCFLSVCSTAVRWRNKEKLAQNEAGSQSNFGVLRENDESIRQSMRISISDSDSR